ncbi:hypothetical protein Tco_0946019 [Tanacetum coccineum]
MDDANKRRPGKCHTLGREREGTVVKSKSKTVVMLEGTLYQKSFLGPWLRCVRPEQAEYVIREIHEGSCSMNSGAPSHTTSPWLFNKLGIDICRLFPEADCKAVIPMEIEMSSLRCFMVNKTKNDEGLPLSLDLLEEKREPSAIAEEKHKRKMEKYYNSKVRNTILNPRDLVYRSNEASRKEDTGKLGSK